MIQIRIKKAGILFPSWHMKAQGQINGFGALEIEMGQGVSEGPLPPLPLKRT